jgi:hypothetical protein
MYLICEHPNFLTRRDELQNLPDLQVKQARYRARHSACHAEGRGFESLQPLAVKAPLLAGFSVCIQRCRFGARVLGYHFWVPVKRIICVRVGVRPPGTEGRRISDPVDSADVEAANARLGSTRLAEVRLKVPLAEAHRPAYP